MYSSTAKQKIPSNHNGFHFHEFFHEKQNTYILNLKYSGMVTKPARHVPDTVQLCVLHIKRPKLGLKLTYNRLEKIDLRAGGIQGGGLI